METYQDRIEVLAIMNYQHGFGNRGPTWINSYSLMDTVEKNNLKRSIKGATVANSGQPLKPGDLVENFSKLISGTVSTYI